VRLAVLVYVSALTVMTLLPIHWTLGTSRRPADYRPQLVPFQGILQEVK
jgi:glycopeptide antibiotics resistance protein